MDILGLENNYYLAGNDIWIQVSNFPKTPIRLELKCTNNTTLATLPVFRLYADINNIFKFNISQTIRPIQPYPVYNPINTMSSYKLEFTVTFDDNTSETTTLNKFFIRGGRVKNNNTEWYLPDGYKLIISKWVEWRGITLPGNPQKIMANLIVDYIPPISEIFKMNLMSGCNAKIIRFLNSIGGYQFWVFETYEIKPKVKSKTVIAQIPMRLRDDAIRNIGTDTVTEITLKTKTPAELQDIILDLIQSSEIEMYDPAGTDEASRWQRLQLSNSNDAVYNSNDMSYLNEITYIIPNYINRDL